MTGRCRWCGLVEQVAWDDGEVIWVECCECGLTSYGMPRDDAPLMVRSIAKPVEEEEFA